MEIAVSQEQGRVPVTVFHIQGDLSAATYEQFEKRAQEAIQSGTRNLILDLAGVPYMSSAGLRALHQVYKSLRGDSAAESDQAVHAGIAAGTFRSPHLKLVNTPPRVLQVLKLSGFDMFLEIHKNLKEAVASF